MDRQNGTALGWLSAAVIAHLIISLVHGAAHARAEVPLSRAATLFVFVVIVAGPMIGLIVAWLAARLGGWLVALTMAGSLVFGLLNHFVFDSPDHVAHVDPRWRLLFTTTAVLLAVTEAIGSGLGVRLARVGKPS